MGLSHKKPVAEAHKEHYAGIFRFFPDAVALTRVSDGILLDINDAFEQLTGCLRSESVGSRTAQLRCWLDPDQCPPLVKDRQLSREQRAAIETLAQYLWKTYNLENGNLNLPGAGSPLASGPMEHGSAPGLPRFARLSPRARPQHHC